MVLLHKMMMVTLLNTMMLITKVLLAAKPDCNWFASTQLPYLLAGVTTPPYPRPGLHGDDDGNNDDGDIVLNKHCG